MLPIMLEGSLQDSIIAGTFSGVSASRATMTTYAASPVLSPFANSNQMDALQMDFDGRTALDCVPRRGAHKNEEDLRRCRELINAMMIPPTSWRSFSPPSYSLIPFIPYTIPRHTPISKHLHTYLFYFPPACLLYSIYFLLFDLFWIWFLDLWNETFPMLN